MTVALKIKVTRKTGSHPLAGEDYEREKMITPRAGGALLLDATVTDGNAKVALPAFFAQLFGTINSGTAGAIQPDKSMLFNVSGDAYVNYVVNVQLDNTTGPFTGYFNLYFMWQWAGGNKYLNYVQLDNFNNDAWTITISGLVSMWGNDLKLFMAVDNAQDTFYWWGGDFQLMVPTTNFPAFVPLVPPPLIGAGGGAPPTFPPPTPPPIGAIPPGVFAFPAVQASQVPPSVAGIPLITFTYGSATTPPASAAFPEFTTTFPHPPIVFSNIFTDGPSPTAPPQTPSTPPLGGSYNTGGQWGPPIGPALPAVVPPRQFMATATMEHEAESYEPENHEEADPEHDDEPHESHRSSKPKRGRRRK